MKEKAFILKNEPKVKLSVPFFVPNDSKRHAGSAIAALRRITSAEPAEAGAMRPGFSQGLFSRGRFLPLN